MNAPFQAIGALAWAIVGPPVLVFAATRPRRGKLTLHAALMLASVSVELGIVLGFGLLEHPSPRRAALAALPIFKVHLAFAYSTLAGAAWQVSSRLVPRLRSLHRMTGPYVVLVWCLALLTGIYNYAFLYVIR